VSIPLAALVTLAVVSFVPLLPTEPVLVSMGVLAAADHTTPTLVIAVAAISCSLSDHLLYGLGRATGARLLTRLRRRPSVDSAASWLQRNSVRWGAPVLIVGRWLPAGGTVGAVLAGTLRWKLSRFTPTSVVGSTLWSTYAAMLGYLGGSITGQPVIGLVLSLGVAALTTALGGLVLRRAGRRAHATDPTGPVGAVGQVGAVGTQEAV
jgi:membrane protein DedA with SNARE-associated domain